MSSVMTGWDKTGPCSRCRAPFVPFVLHHGDYDEVYSLNLCQNCVYKQVGESIGKTLMGNGTKIWEVMSKEPKIGLHPLRECTFDEKRELKIYSRLLEAKLYVMKGKKHRRTCNACMRAKSWHCNMRVWMSCCL